MKMSSTSSSLVALAILSIILATTASTTSDVTRLLEISVTTRSSTAVATSSAIAVVADRRTSRRNGTNEIASTNDPEHTSTIRTMTEPDQASSSGVELENRSTAFPEITTTSFVATQVIPIDKNGTSPIPPAAAEAQPAVDSSPRQERLVGLVDNATKHSPERAATMAGPSSGFLRDDVTLNVGQSTRSPEMKALTSSTTSATTQLTTTSVSNASTTGPTTRKSPGSKSRNELIGGNFHEIKPAQKINSKTSGYLGGKIVKPNVASALGKYTPYFEDGQEELNVTARIGSTVVLDCEIGMLGNKTVTWSYHSADVIRLLTVGRNAYSVDQRISLYFKYPTNWRLRIQYATPRDSGLYECQVATYPPLVKKIHLLVTAPILVIMDDSGRIKSGERHLKAGSALRLRCEARDVPEQYNETVIWTRGDEILSEDVSENRTTDFLDGREIQVIVSTIVVEKATPRHAGNYSCVVPEKAKTTVAVHVLNGELPAAVHDGNGVSRSVLNLWLIHLTVSYVFSR